MKILPNRSGGCRLGLLFAVIVLQACAAAIPQRNVTWHCDTIADRAVNEQDWEKALQGHERLLAGQPDNCLARYHLGYIMGKLNRRDEEIVCYRQAIDCGYVHDDQLYFNLGMAYGDRQQYDLAEQAFSRAVRISPRNADNFFGLGLTAQMAGRVQPAEKALLRAVALQADHWEARLALARLYLAENRWLEAEKQIDAVLKSDPENAEALDMRETIAFRKHMLYEP